MRSRRGAIVGSLLAGMLLGFFWLGQVLYKTAIDLDSSAFLAGSWIEPALAALGITSPRPIAGPFWMVVGLFLVLVGVFFIVRRAVQLRVAETDPGRRSLLTGAATGAGIALASTLLAGGVGFARALFGIGNGGRGWRGPLTQVFSGDVVKTDPDPRASWQGSRIRDFRRLGRTDFQISDIVSFFEYQHVDEYLFASGQSATETDLAVLRAYDHEILGSYCAPHCGACLTSCPESLPIHDALRHRMYFEDYGDEKEAMRLYSRLERDASVCASCSAPCLGSCPVGIPIQERMVAAHDLLSLS